MPGLVSPNVSHVQRAPERIHKTALCIVVVRMAGVLLATLLLAIVGCAEDGAIPTAKPVSGPTYYGQVAEILSANCVSCHYEDGISFPLHNADWAVQMAPDILEALAVGAMPPWPPGPDSPPMKDERTLAPEDKAQLVAWARAGAPLGDAPSPPVASIVSRDLADPQPDHVLAVDPPYHPDQSRYDDYRCFLLDLPFDRDTFVTGYRVRPDQATLVHHALLFEIGPGAVDAAVRRDQAEEGPGWTCFGGPGVEGNLGSFGFLGFWVPGTSGTDFPESTGKLVRAGSGLGLQVHYNMFNASGTEADATAVELFVAGHDTELEPIREVLLVAPVEVRCPGLYPSDPNDPCNREYAVQRSELKLIAQAVHFPCGTRPGFYIDRDIGDGSVQHTSCDQRVQQDSLALGVVGHMHLRGRSIRIELNPDNVDTLTLLHIPEWDFEWQGQYWFQEPIPIKRGDTVRISCTYNNSGPIQGPDGSLIPPRYMTWGEGTSDEMCIGVLNVISDGDDG